MKLVTSIHGINSEQRLKVLRDASGYRPIVVLDNGVKLHTMPAGATYHYCLVGEPCAVANVVTRLHTGKRVSIKISRAVEVVLSEKM